MNSRRMNRLEELGRVDAEKAYTKKGKKNLRGEKSRIVRELKATGGKVDEPKRKKMGPGTPRMPKKDKLTEKGKRVIKSRMTGGDSTEILFPNVYSGKKRESKKNGGSLKPVKPSQKGLKKLPTKVRNKMGYMKKGGRVGMGKAMRGGGCVR